MRKRVTYTLPEEMIEKIKDISDKTLIPQAKLVEKALENLIRDQKQITQNK